MTGAVVTGASGMIGATLVRRLVEQGIDVLAVVRPGTQKLDNLPADPRVAVVECALDDLAAFTLPTGSTGSYDVLYHFAWDGTSGPARDDATLQVRNIRYAIDAVDLAARLGCRVFVGAGSQAEYGRSDEDLSPETPAFPESGYGIAKLAAGRLCALRARQRGMRCCWVRILSVYGPMDNEGAVITATLGRLLRGETPHFTPGGQIWDFLYSEDAARALELVGRSGHDRADYVLGSGTGRPLKEYFLEAAAAVDPALAPSFDLPYPAGQVMHLVADLRALTEDTGFVPEVPFAEGVRRTADWLRDHATPRKGNHT